MKKIILLSIVFVAFGSWAQVGDDSPDVPSEPQVVDMPIPSDFDLRQFDNAEEISISDFVRESEEGDREAYWPDTSTGDREFGPRERRRNSNVCRPGTRLVRLKDSSPTINAIAGRPLEHYIRGDNGRSYFGPRHTFCW